MKRKCNMPNEGPNTGLPKLNSWSFQVIYSKFKVHFSPCEDCRYILDKMRQCILALCTSHLLNQ